MFLKKAANLVLSNRLYAGLVVLLGGAAPWLSAVISGGVGQMLLVFFMVTISWIGPVLVAFVTLRKGTREGLVLLAWALVPSVAITILNGFTFVIGQYALGMLLLWVLSGILAGFANWKMVLQVATIIGIGVVIMAHILVPDLHALWLSKLKADWNQVQALAKAEASQRQLIRAIMDGMAKVATGSLMVLIFIDAFCKLVIARAWQASVYNPGGLKREFLLVRLDYWVAVLMVLILILSWFKLTVVIDLLPVVLVVFIVAGLSLAHCWFNQLNNSKMWLILFYVFLIVFARLVLPLLLLAALTDTALDVRRRFKFKLP